MWPKNKMKLKIAQTCKTHCAILLLMCINWCQSENLTGLLINRQPRIHHGYYLDYSKLNKNYHQEEDGLVTTDSNRNSVTLKKITSTKVSAVDDLYFKGNQGKFFFFK